MAARSLAQPAGRDRGGGAAGLRGLADGQPVPAGDPAQRRHQARSRAERGRRAAEACAVARELAARTVPSPLRPPAKPADAALPCGGAAAQPDRILAVRGVGDARRGRGTRTGAAGAALHRRLLQPERGLVHAVGAAVGGGDPGHAGRGGAAGAAVPLRADAVEGGAVSGGLAGGDALPQPGGGPDAIGARVAGPGSGGRSARGGHDGGPRRRARAVSVQAVSQGRDALERGGRGAGDAGGTARIGGVGRGRAVRAARVQLDVVRPSRGGWTWTWPC